MKTCDCIKNIELKIKPDVEKRFSKKNKPVKYFHLQTTLGGRPIVRIDISLSNQQKIEQSFIVCGFCPFCGNKYE